MAQEHCHPESVTCMEKLYFIAQLVKHTNKSCFLSHQFFSNNIREQNLLTGVQERDYRNFSMLYQIKVLI